MNALLLTLAAIGHVILWVALVNRLHAVSIPRIWIHLLTAVCGAAIIIIPLTVAHMMYWQWQSRESLAASTAWIAVQSYVVASAVVCLASLVQWLRLKWHPERRGVLLANHTLRFLPAEKSPAPLAAAGWPTWITRLPLNQALEIHVHEKQLAIPRLSREHDRLRIVHLSDLHMSGRITKEYFEQVVEQVNRCQPDLVAITGDLVERSKCLDWIPDTLGRLQARGGVYYVLGNHDRHVNERKLHAALQAAGLVHVGSIWQHVTVGKVPLIMAGNELPWYSPTADLRDCPEHNTSGLPLRVLLSHSPDQIGWAQDQHIDLMLAGHNHGGQVRLPIVGAILAPSIYGVRYAAGAFRVGNTVLHVSRGTSSLTPIRVNCPPEIAVLELRGGSQTQVA